MSNSTQTSLRSYHDGIAAQRMFGRINDVHRITTRYDRLANKFLAALSLIAAVCYWIYVRSLTPVGYGLRTASAHLSSPSKGYRGLRPK